MKNRYTIRHESGSDWAVVDASTNPPIVKASGLTVDEAEQTAEAWNDAESNEKAAYA